jgi:hypothetical protein
MCPNCSNSFHRSPDRNELLIAVRARDAAAAFLQLHPLPKQARVNVRRRRAAAPQFRRRLPGGVFQSEYGNPGNRDRTDCHTRAFRAPRCKVGRHVRDPDHLRARADDHAHRRILFAAASSAQGGSSLRRRGGGILESPHVCSEAVEAKTASPV